jgi:hypothetical protein
MKKTISVLLLLLLCSNLLFAKDTSDEINAATDKIMPQVIEWRRHLHQYPELSNREFKTSRFVEDYLRKLGLEVKTGIAKTGVVGILRGSQPGPDHRTSRRYGRLACYGKS